MKYLKPVKNFFYSFLLKHCAHNHVEGPLDISVEIEPNNWHPLYTCRDCKQLVKWKPTGGFKTFNNNGSKHLDYTSQTKINIKPIVVNLFTHKLMLLEAVVDDLVLCSFIEDGQIFKQYLSHESIKIFN